ncbi:MAG: transposase [Bryobacteraceae bacterium]
MKQEAYSLDESRRAIVLAAVQDACAHRQWTLAAAHVRTNHVHCVIDAPREPEFVLNVCKARASRALNEAGLDTPDRRRWSRHGSTRYLWSRDNVARAIDYVVEQQGRELSLYVNPQPF